MKYQKNEVLYIVETETDCGSTDFHFQKRKEEVDKMVENSDHYMRVVNVMKVQVLQTYKIKPILVEEELS